mmetsp:Transcript_42673/g.67589  ORF Transcript_42673/g.67589 Transcript_42673/m.67589 type:complete len:285 (-) Transcript_42673:185-1039(-)
MERCGHASHLASHRERCTASAADGGVRQVEGSYGERSLERRDRGATGRCRGRTTRIDEARRFSAGLLHRLGRAAPRPAAGAGDAARRQQGLHRRRGDHAHHWTSKGQTLGSAEAAWRAGGRLCPLRQCLAADAADDPSLSQRCSLDVAATRSHGKRDDPPALIQRRSPGPGPPLLCRQLPRQPLRLAARWRHGALRAAPRAAAGDGGAAELPPGSCQGPLSRGTLHPPRLRRDLRGHRGRAALRGLRRGGGAGRGAAAAGGAAAGSVWRTARRYGHNRGFHQTH